jgi:hypothetical protein
VHGVDVFTIPTRSWKRCGSDSNGGAIRIVVEQKSP